MESHCFCFMCSIHFSVAHGGRNDVDRHRESDGHKWNAKSRIHVLNAKMTAFSQLTKTDKVV